MAPLPDPRPRLSPEDTASLQELAAVRAPAEGRSAPPEVYVQLFHHPALARRVAALGEEVRFRGVLPARARELAILRFAARRGLRYEWAHHRGPGLTAGLDESVLALLASVDAGARIGGPDALLIQAVDTVLEGRPLPLGLQAELVDLFGEAGVVELVVLCGLYGLIGFILSSFEVELEEGFPPPLHWS